MSDAPADILTRRQRQAVELRRRLKKQSLIARAMGRSESAVCAILQRADRRLVEFLQRVASDSEIGLAASVYQDEMNDTIDR